MNNIVPYKMEFLSSPEPDLLKTLSLGWDSSNALLTAILKFHFKFSKQNSI